MSNSFSLGTPVLIIFILLFFIIIIVSMYNGLIRRKNEVDNAFGGIDAQLKKRYDLIPNLVETVKQYAKHEKELLSEVTRLRSRATENDLSNEEKIALDNQITKGMQGIMVAVENYPDLKASENFIMLQRSLNEVEAQISAARRTFNAVITRYNNGIESFPQSIIANMMKMERKEVFTIPEIERENVKVKELF